MNIWVGLKFVCTDLRKTNLMQDVLLFGPSYLKRCALFMLRSYFYFYLFFYFGSFRWQSIKSRMLFSSKVEYFSPYILYIISKILSKFFHQLLNQTESLANASKKEKMIANWALCFEQMICNKQIAPFCRCWIREFKAFSKHKGRNHVSNAYRY